MSQDLELALRIKADVQQALHEIKGLRDDLKKTGQSGKEAGTGVGAAGKAARSAATDFGKLRRALVGLFALHELKRFLGGIVQAEIELQRMQYTLLSVTGTMAGARKELQFVTDVANKLGLDIKNTAAGYSRLSVSAKAAGVSQEEMHKSFLGLAEAFTVLHTPAQDVNGLLVQLEQGMSLGKLQMQDFRAIAQHMPGTMNLASQAVQRLGGSLQEMLSRGGVPAKQFFIEFSQLLHDKYGKAAEDASHSVLAATNRFNNAMFSLRTQLAQSGFIDSFTNALQDFSQTLSDPSVIEGLKSLVSGLGEVIELAAEAASKIGLLADAVDRLATDRRNSDPNNLEGLKKDLAILKDVETELRTRLSDAQESGKKWYAALFGGFRGAQQAALQQLKDNLAQQAIFTARIALLQHDQGQKNKAAAAKSGSGSKPATFNLSGGASAVTRAAAEANIKLAQDAAERVKSLLKQQLDDGVISYKAYYDKVSAIQTAAVDKQIALIRKELSAEQESAKGAQGPQQEQSLARVKKLQAELIILQRQRSEISNKAWHDEIKAEKALADQLAGVRAQLLTDQGDPVAAKRIELQQQFRDLIKRLTGEGNQAGIDIVNSLIDMEAAKVRLTQLQDRFGATLKNIAQDIKDVHDAEDAGTVSRMQAIAQVTADVAKAQAAYNAEIAKYKKLLDEGKISQETFNKAVVDAKGKLQGVKDAAKQANQDMGQFAIQAARNMQTAFADFLFDPFSKGVKGLVEGFVTALRRMAAEAAAARLGKKLFGNYDKTGQVGGILGPIFNAVFHHDGGMVGRDGTVRPVSPLAFIGAPRLHSGTLGGLRSDEVPAILQQGEVVLSRQDVQNAQQMAQGGGQKMEAHFHLIDTKDLLQRMGEIKREITTMVGGTAARYNIGGAS